MASVSREIVERLYAAPPEHFVAARAEAVAGARAAGDSDAAREIAKLRKPTVAAWLVNLLAIRRPDLVAGLVELSTALRSAQRELRGPQLRELSAQRRGAVNALVAEAHALAVAADPGLSASKLPLAEVEATLNAALSDADVAEQVRSGQLVRAATYAGFGEVPRPQLRLVTGGAEKAPTKAGERKRAAARREEGGAETAEQSRKAEEAARAARRRALTKELADARTQRKRADSELERAVAAERDGAAALSEIETALADLERRRVDAEREVSRRKLARKAAERSAVGARRRVGEVEAAVEALDAEAAAAGRKTGGARR
jgi:hypothetical protein